MYLKISKLNHACNPNAEITERDNEEDTKLVALKPIKKDEKIFITYLHPQQDGSKTERMETLLGTYGFRCGCTVCKLTGMDAMVSDCRRQLISAMAYKLQDKEPPHLEYINFHGQKVAHRLFGLHAPKLRVPLKVEEKAAYCFLMAKLLDSEGRIGIDVAKYQINAALYLAIQILDTKAALVLPSVQYVIDWMEAGIRTMSEVRKPGSKDLKDAKQHWKDIQTRSLWPIYKVFVGLFHFAIRQALTSSQSEKRNNILRDSKLDLSQIFAIEVGEQWRLLSQEECKDLFRNGELTSNAGHAIGVHVKRLMEAVC